MSKIMTILTMLIFYSACNRNKEILGVYEIDKYVILNKDNQKQDYQFLELTSEGSFKLFHSREDSTYQLTGKWKILNKSKNRGLGVQFRYNGQAIEGTLKGNIFYFIHPNDFHINKYQSVLYVKSVKR